MLSVSGALLEVPAMSMLLCLSVRLSVGLSVALVTLQYPLEPPPETFSGEAWRLAMVCVASGIVETRQNDVPDKRAGVIWMVQ